MNRRRSLVAALALALAAGAAACAGDITAVNGKRAESAPDVALLRTTYGIDALYYVGDLDEVALTPNGDFNDSPPGFPDGTLRSGNIDRQTGRFHSTVTWPPGYFYRVVTDTGVLRFGTGNRIIGATYGEDRLAGSPDPDHFDLTFTQSPVELDLQGTLAQGDVEITSSVEYGSFDRIEVVETQSVPTVYVEHIDSIYPELPGQPALVQTWSRDELATAVSPDTSGGFTLEVDGTGNGEVDWYFDHGITEDWQLAISETAEDVAIVRQNPATIGTDGLGHLHLAIDGSGSGYYDLFDPDGSSLSRNYTWFRSGAMAETWSFDDAATSWPVDSSGDTTYNYDGSGGTGDWTRFDGPGHAAETCTYTFDSGDAITSESCN